MGQYLNSMSSVKRQRGVVLFIALIALVAMTLAGIALMRSVDTANVIAGNFAFKESTIHATDVGTELAITALPGFVANDGRTAVANRYFPVQRNVDVLGMPTNVDWTAVPVTSIPNTGNDVQYVIERMCDPIPANPAAVPPVVASPNGPIQTSITDVTDYCVTVPKCTPPSSAGTAPLCSAGDINYRITTRVIGPRGTVSVVQTIVSM